MSIRRIQLKTNSGTGTSSVVVTLDDIPTGNSRIILFVSTYDSSALEAVSSIIHTGATYTQLKDSTFGNHNHECWISTLMDTSVNKTITINTTNPVDDFAVTAIEYGGIRTNDSNDDNNGSATVTLISGTLSGIIGEALYLVGAALAAGSSSFDGATNGFEELEDLAMTNLTHGVYEKIAKNLEGQSINTEITIPSNNWISTISSFIALREIQKIKRLIIPIPGGNNVGSVPIKHPSITFPPF